LLANADKNSKMRDKRTGSNEKSNKKKTRGFLAKTAKWFLIVSFLIFAAGWIITLPLPHDFSSTTAGNNSGKAVIVRIWGGVFSIKELRAFIVII
jgi:hypothetical protein